ncbi:MAG: hypothetical protein QOI60_389 [Actinomycetota bacterium]|nr:hypothetical protein [Actinomycetota bacterium]MEA2556644.1 hypothetical protein [Actinomycetota bacterium]
MNDESLGRANAFLAAVASRTQVGAVMDVTPAEIGRELGLPDPLSTARAVRALIARKRLQPAQGSYRLLDARPVDAGERELIGRKPRGVRRGPRSSGSGEGGRGDDHLYSDFGRAAVDKLIELGRENATLRASLKAAREEARTAREARIESDRRSEHSSQKLHELEGRAEMAESNLRTMLAAARGREVRSDSPVGDSEMAAILGVLKGDAPVNGETDTGE